MHIYSLLKSKKWQLLQALENISKTGNATQICAAFYLSLCVSFLTIVIMLGDSRFIILISDPDLQGQLLLFKISNNN